ncbi:MAG: low molecular weight protein-tyrosine-phosphatase [Ramlibacter sp.]|nr:low molecular weight protein-tyrosine-phosphatase [Ramlibacter sp.]
MKSILVICVGNICRSPMAEALLKQQFPERTIWSAGLRALVGDAADPLAIETAAAHGLGLSAHRAQQLAGWMCQSAELILVMEQGHKTEVEQLYPLVRGKVFRLGEHGKFDIADPYRQPKSAFETVYADIARGMAEWVPRIRQLG